MKLFELKNVIYGNDKEQKEIILSYLNDVFESYSNNIEDFIQIINFLIGQVGKESDLEVQNLILNTLAHATVYRNLEAFDFDPIEDIIDGLCIESLTSAISILGFSHNDKYIPTLRRFITHTDRIVSQDAKNAITEISERKEANLINNNKN